MTTIVESLFQGLVGLRWSALSRSGGVAGAAEEQRSVWWRIGKPAAFAASLLACFAVHAHDLRAHPTVPATAPTQDFQIGAPFQLTTADNQEITEKNFRGRWLLASFGYTSCPDVCPMTLARMSEAFDQLGSASDRVRGLFLTLDPRRDTPEVLGQYMKAFSPRIIAATGTDAQIAAAATAFRIRYEIVGDIRRGSYAVNHPVGMMLFNPEGRFVTLIPGGASGTDIRKTLSEFMSRKR